MFNPLTCLTVARIPVAQNAHVVDIGNQRMGISQGIFDLLHQNKLLNTPPESTKDFYMQLGYKEYLAIDVNEKMDAIAMDLNHDIIEKYNFSRQFDLVNNTGSSEHIFNQYSLFKNIHQLCRINGFMLHILPFTRWYNHGFYNYNPVLFRDLAMANNYKLTFFHIGNRHGDVIDLAKTITLDEAFKEKNPDALASAIDKLFAHGKKQHERHYEIFNVVCMQKIHDFPFQMPMQGKYVQDIGVENIKDSYQQQNSIKNDNVRNKPTKQKTKKTNKLSILQNFSKLESHPYPHFVIENALDTKTFKELSDNFPEEYMVNELPLEPNGISRYASFVDTLNNNNITAIWQDFIAYHNSEEFYYHVIDIFENAIIDTLGSDTLEYLRTMPLGKRKIDKTPIVTDAQITMQEPLSATETSRTDHFDNPIEIYAALLYFKPSHDRSSGSEFLIYEKTDPDNPFFTDPKRAATDSTQYQLYKKVPYKANNAVMFLNNYLSLHGVAPRKKATKRRRSVNIIAEFQGSEHHMWQLQKNSKGDCSILPARKI